MLDFHQIYSTTIKLDNLKEGRTKGWMFNSSMKSTYINSNYSCKNRFFGAVSMTIMSHEPSFSLIFSTWIILQEALYPLGNTVC